MVSWLQQTVFGFCLYIFRTQNSGRLRCNSRSVASGVCDGTDSEQQIWLCVGGCVLEWFPPAYLPACLPAKPEATNSKH
jgi:hypothetical protein